MPFTEGAETACRSTFPNMLKLTARLRRSRPRLGNRLSTGGKMARSERALTAVEALHAAYNRHDADAAAKLYDAASGRHEDVALGHTAVGHEAIRDGLLPLFKAIPDVEWTTEKVIANGDRAIASYVMRGTLRHDLGPFVGKGQRLALPGVHVVETDPRGCVSQSTDFWDSAEFSEQVTGGKLPAAASPVTEVTSAGSDGFRSAMRMLAGGVAVVTTEVDGRPWGLTVSACSSLTADPPKVMVSLQSSTTSCRAIEKNGRFGVSLLASDQVEVARTCSEAGKPKFIDRLVDDALSVDRAPVISGSLAHFDCSLVDSHTVHDHLMLIGLVREIFMPREIEEGGPLVYFARSFRTVGGALV
ncbi:MAG: flavin reductase [Actinobacteria bacterium]|nr:flavin reductase [Actinomycetota bacterium]